MEKLKQHLTKEAIAWLLSIASSAILLANLFTGMLTPNTPAVSVNLPDQKLGVRENLLTYHTAATTTASLRATTSVLNLTPSTATNTTAFYDLGANKIPDGRGMATALTRSIEVNVFGNASSSLANVTIRAQGSHNNIDWYDLNCSNCNKQVSLATSSNSVASNYSATNYTLTPLAESFTRLLFSPSSSTSSPNGNFQLYIQAVLKNNSGAD